jgi:hypothetical protein
MSKASESISENAPPGPGPRTSLTRPNPTSPYSWRRPQSSDGTGEVDGGSRRRGSIPDVNSQVPAGADVTLASYEAGAKRYVERTPPSLGPHLSNYLDSLASYLNFGDSLLELGCGPGRAAEYLETKHLRVCGALTARRRSWT